MDEAKCEEQCGGCQANAQEKTPASLCWPAIDLPESITGSRHSRSPHDRRVAADSPKLHLVVYNRSLAMNLPAIQSALRERNIDAWLFYDHHHRDPIAYRVLGLPTSLMVTRRWFYLIPAEGEPLKLVHKIEAGHLDSLPGKKNLYSGWQELFDQLKSMLAKHLDLAM